MKFCSIFRKATFHYLWSFLAWEGLFKGLSKHFLSLPWQGLWKSNSSSLRIPTWFLVYTRCPLKKIGKYVYGQDQFLKKTLSFKVVMARCNSHIPIPKCLFSIWLNTMEQSSYKLLLNSDIHSIDDPNSAVNAKYISIIAPLN